MFPIRDVQGRTGRFRRPDPALVPVGREGRRSITTPRNAAVLQERTALRHRPGAASGSQGGLPRHRGRLHRRPDGAPARDRAGGGHHGHGPQRPAPPQASRSGAARGAGLRCRRGRRRRAWIGPWRCSSAKKWTARRDACPTASIRAIFWSRKDRSPFDRLWTERRTCWSYKLARLMDEAAAGVEEQRRAVDGCSAVLAAAPDERKREDGIDGQSDCPSPRPQGGDRMERLKELRDKRSRAGGAAAGATRRKRTEERSAPAARA